MDQDHLHAISSRIGARFPRRWQRDYVRIKLSSDPVFAATAGLLSHRSLPLLDVGCGMGLLAFFLRECGFTPAYLGIDLDASKIESAQRIAGDHADGLTFRVGEAGALPPFHGDVALLDVLHYLPQSAQQTLLVALAERVAPGGVLVMRNVVREPGWRFRATVLEERLIHAMRWMRVGASHFPTRSEIEAPLQAAGLQVDIQPLWGRTPFNSYLIVARRSGD